MSRSKRIVPIVAAAAVIAASVLLVGFSGTAAVGIALIYRIAQPITVLRGILLAFCVCYVVLGCTLFTGFFGVVPLTVTEGLCCLAIVAAAVLGFGWAYNYSTTKAKSLWDGLRAPGMRA